MAEWISMESEKPKLKQRIVVLRADGNGFAGVYEVMPMERCMDYMTGRFYYGFEFWIPLPEITHG